MSKNQQILDSAIEYLRECVYPRANEIDSDVAALKEALDGLCERGLMALRRPEKYGGPAFPEPMFREFQESVARYSGSLAFLQTQHQSAVSMIAKGDNEGLKEAALPHMATGERLIGIGFSHLRRPGPPMLTAERTDDGYRLTGTVPWVTGFGLYGEFLIGATKEDGTAVFGVVPFVPTEKDGGTIAFSDVMRLAAMESPQTVSAKLDGWLLRDELVAFHKPAGWIQNNDLINITLQGFFALGCARAGLDQVHAAYKKKASEFIKEAYEALTQELDECRARMVALQATGDEETTTQEKLEVRAWAIDLAVRCAHAGVAANSGASNSSKHPAQRVYREALVFTVSAQTSDVMRATLSRLAERGGQRP